VVHGRLNTRMARTMNCIGLADKPGLDPEKRIEAIGTMGMSFSTVIQKDAGDQGASLVK